MWAQILNIVLGIWLMASPGILGYNGVAADINHIVGPVVASFAIIALSGCTKSVSKCNIPLGLFLVIAPWILQYESGNAIANDIFAGLLITGFSFIKRKTNKQYGGGWSVVWPFKTEKHIH
jgi:hypothetical protein